MGSAGVPLLERSAELPPLYRQALQALETLAMATSFDDLSPLPPEPQLAARLGVSRGTLRRATDELAREGLLRIQAGRGTFVNKQTQIRRVVRSQLIDHVKPDSRFDLDITQFVPDFDGSDECTRQTLELDAVRDATTIFVAPDNSLIGLRRSLLLQGKRLLVPTFGGRRGMFLIDGSIGDPAALAGAATLDGMEEHGRVLELRELRELGHVDVMVTGAVAVTSGGVHVGGGEGYLDLEWGILRELDLVDDDVPVIAVVHTTQFVDIPLDPKASDCLIDIVVTPAETVRLDHAAGKPSGLDREWIRHRRAAVSSYFQQLNTDR
ncbi:5-formyltetrahydrofolate cyclo-ligase [Amnibacterium flavum]|nr:5-formyltetrahydrofolate cyclo-ligase [Amnibacterium flavum]